MTQHEGEHGARHVRLADLPKAEIGDHLWHPVRRALGATGFGVGAYSAVRAGDVLVGAHDEKGLGSNRHEELYVVLAGRALFELDGREVEVGPEEFLLVDPEVRRGARALADATSVLVIGGAPGAVAPAPYEHWYTALTADDPHDAAEIAAGGLAQFPDHGQLNYQLACFRALAGELDVAARHLRRAVASDERAWTWLEDDSDLDALRSVPGAVPTRTRVGPLHVEQAGAGPDVVLVHAGVADGRMWDAQWVEWAVAVVASRDSTCAASAARICRKGRTPTRATFSPCSTRSGSSARHSSARRSAAGSRSTSPPRSPIASPASCSPVRAFRTTRGRRRSRRSAPRRTRQSRRVTSTRAAEVNVDFWVPSASEPVRAAIREQQRNAFALQVGRDDEEELLTDDLTARLRSGRRPDARPRRRARLRRLPRDRGPAGRRAPGHSAGDDLRAPATCPSLEQPEAFDAVVLPFVDSLA